MSTQNKTRKISKAAAKPAETTEAANAGPGEEVAEAADEQVRETSSTAVAGYDDFAAFQKDSMDAFVACGTIFARGFEAIGKEYLAYAEASAESGSKAAQALLTAKSVEEFVELQGAFARKTFDSTVAETNKLSEMSLKIAADAIEPVQKQITVAVEAAMKPVAI